jgi:filamentous hemagglutinin
VGNVAGDVGKVASDVDKVVDAAKGVKGISSNLAPGGGLAAHEAAGGHLIARHVGYSEVDLANRLATSNVRTASSFTDLKTAETSVASAINANQLAIQNYINGSTKGYLEIDYSFTHPIGISLTRGTTNAVAVSNVRIFITRDPLMSNGYRIVTGYPTP